MEQRRITLGERTYQLEPWSVTDGDAWAFRLLRLLSTVAPKAEPQAAGTEVAPVTEQGIGLAEPEGDALSVGTILERVTPEEFIAFRDACFKHTSLVELDADGVETVRDLVRARESMRGRYTETMAIVIAHVTHEFAPFLLSAPALMGGRKRKEGARGASGSASPRTSTG